MFFNFLLSFCIERSKTFNRMHINLHINETITFDLTLKLNSTQLCTYKRNTSTTTGIRKSPFSGEDILQNEK